MAHPLLTRIRLMIGCFVLGLAIIAALFVGHHLSPRGFAISVLLLAVSGVVVLTKLFYSVRDLPEREDLFRGDDELRLRRRLLASKIGLAVFILLLFSALWETRTRSLSENLIGITAGSFWVFASIVSLRGTRARLKQLQDRRTP